MRNRKWRRLLAAGALLLIGVLAERSGVDLSALGIGASPTAVEEVADARSGDAGVSRVERAFAERTSGFMVTVEGRVVKSLRDDNDGSRHQRFLVELAGGHTLLVAHNIDLARRVPLSEGDRVRVHGQYEWNERGGVLHWTHHDPAGRHEGGWIELRGKRTE